MYTGAYYTTFTLGMLGTTYGLFSLIKVRILHSSPWESVEILCTGQRLLGVDGLVTSKIEFDHVCRHSFHREVTYTLSHQGPRADVCQGLSSELRYFETAAHLAETFSVSHMCNNILSRHEANELQ